PVQDRHSVPPRRSADLCLVAMEPPVSFQADEVRNRKVDVLRAMRKFDAEAIKKGAVRGQYGRGWLEGKEVPAYREEKGVSPTSRSEEHTSELQSRENLV